MKQAEIKSLLLAMYKIDFNINKKVNIYSTKTQAFGHTVSFEHADKKGKWHESYFDVCGVIYKNTSQDENYIDSWEINKIETVLDGVKINLITLDDLRRTQETISNN